LTVVIVTAGVLGYRRHHEILRLPDPSIRQIADWARRSTPLDAVFLVDTRWGVWRPLSERAAFVTWKEGAALMWQKDFANVWIERLAALGWDFRRGMPSMDAVEDEITTPLTVTDVRALASRYRVDYWIVPRARALSLPVAFEGRAFKVLAVTR
jgi:hypothetical protein